MKSGTKPALKIGPDKILDFSEAKDYGSSDDKWVKDSEIYLNSLLDKIDEKSTKDPLETTNEIKEISNNDD